MTHRPKFVADDGNSVVPVCFIFDFFPDGGEVHELLALGVQKLPILVLAVDQLED